MNPEENIARFRESYDALRSEIGKVIVGQEAIVDGTLNALFANGHVLLEGVPGLGKTLLVRTLSQVLDLSFNRIQFTPDLMPADVIGTNMVHETDDGKRVFDFQHGPIFAHLVLADEINRATPKTQSAMLEAMQERSVTAGGEIRKLDTPFFVLATQNPIDQEGTYPLPEAQLDRFFLQTSGRLPIGGRVVRSHHSHYRRGKCGGQQSCGRQHSHRTPTSCAAGSGGISCKGLRRALDFGHSPQHRNRSRHHQPIPPLRQQPSRCPNVAARSQGARVDRGPFQRQLRRHRCRCCHGFATPANRQLRSRGGRHYN